MAFGGTLPQTDVQGFYVEARTADVYTGPCFANGESGLVGKRAVLGWNVRKAPGTACNLTGSALSASSGRATRSAYELAHPFPVKAVLIVDEKANLEQRMALKSLAQQMSGELLSDVVKVEYRPIELDVTNNDVHGGQAKLVAGELAKIETRALTHGDDICSNEEVWYKPLAKLGHAMPAYTLANATRATDSTPAGACPASAAPSSASSTIRTKHHRRN